MKKTSPRTLKSRMEKLHIGTRTPKILKVAELGHEVLRKKAVTVPVEEIVSPDFQDFIEDMIETLKDSTGVGLAAPQVYESKRVMIMHSFTTPRNPKAPEFGPTALINPKIISKSAKKVSGWEGCLSFPGIRGLVPRHYSVEVEYTDRTGKKFKKVFKDFLARIFQHEFDHLEGIVFLDRIKGKDIITEKEFLKLMSAAPVKSSAKKSFSRKK